MTLFQILWVVFGLGMVGGFSLGLLLGLTRVNSALNLALDSNDGWADSNNTAKEMLGVIKSLTEKQ